MADRPTVYRWQDVCAALMKRLDADEISFTEEELVESGKRVVNVQESPSGLSIIIMSQEETRQSMQLLNAPFIGEIH